MSVMLRRGTAEDAPACGRIAYEAFRSIAQRHNFPPDFPSREIATAAVSSMLSDHRYYPVIAEREGITVGASFMDERGPIAGIGPVTVDPAAQDTGVGRAMMQELLRRARERRFVGVRLVQAAYHARSLSLYTKLGFDAREALSNFQGSALKLTIPGCGVRPVRQDDIEACQRLCIRVHGHERAEELRDAVRQGTASLVERAGRITAYASIVAFWGHAVAESNDDLAALIGATPAFPGPGFLVPSSNGELMRWCLGRGLRVVQQMTLMTIGIYQRPEGAYLPSILF